MDNRNNGGSDRQVMALPCRRGSTWPCRRVSSCRGPVGVQGQVNAERVPFRQEADHAIAALRAANAVVLVNFDDLAAHVAGNLAQLTFLVGRGLIDGRDPQIENSAFHRKRLWFLMLEQ